MKKLLLAFFISAVALNSYAEDKKVPEVKIAPEVKLVCLDIQAKDGKPVIDPKTNKPKQQCTKVKIRKKFEGTTVPKK
jgi:tRNA (Thr-GGU) A37 N-methylase